MHTRFDYEQILERYWQLANLDLNSTKGNITGQLKALELLCEELRRTPQKEASRPQFYRSEWMRSKDQ